MKPAVTIPTVPSFWMAQGSTNFSVPLLGQYVAIPQATVSQEVLQNAQEEFMQEQQTAQPVYLMPKMKPSYVFEKPSYDVSQVSQMQESTQKKRFWDGLRGGSSGMFRPTISRLMSRQQAATILGVSKNASPEDIKKAFRKAALKAHPDTGGSDKAMQEVNKAKDILSENQSASEINSDKYKKSYEDQDKDRDIDASLFSAIDARDLARVKKLVKDGANVNAQSKPVGETPLFRAIFKDAQDIVKFLLDNGVSVNQKSKYTKKTILHMAAIYDHAEILKLLLEKGADFNLKDVDGKTPVDVAIKNNSLRSLKVLIDAGAGTTEQRLRYGPHVDEDQDIDASLFSAIDACDLDKVKKLVKNGANVNAQSKARYVGETPLYRAVFRNAEDIVKFLFDNGVIVNKKCEYSKRTALHIAAVNDHADMLKLLLEKGADFNVKDVDGKTPVDVAIEYNSLKSLKVLLDAGAGTTAQKLRYGAIKGLWDHSFKKHFRDHRVAFSVAGLGASLFIAYKSLFNHEKAMEQSPIIIADKPTSESTSVQGEAVELKRIADYKISDASEDRRVLFSIGCFVAIVSYLVYNYGKSLEDDDNLSSSDVTASSKKVNHVSVQNDNANIDMQDSDGFTALHRAIFDRSVVAVKILLQDGANTEIVNNDGYYPLHIAALRGDVEIVKLLLGYGANIEVREKKNQSTALHLAADYGQIQVIQTLILHKANINACNVFEETALMYAVEKGFVEIVKMLVVAGANVNAKSLNVYYTPLQLAFCSKNPKIIKTLILHGVDVHTPMNNGFTSLHAAVQFGFLEIVQMLLAHKVDVNVKKQSDGATPLHYAAYLGNAEIVKELLKYNADVNALDKEGYTPLHVAFLPKASLQIKIVQELIAAGADVKAITNDNKTVLDLALCCNADKEIIALLKRHGARSKT
jgi:ankyrin repeat protein